MEPPEPADSYLEARRMACSTGKIRKKTFRNGSGKGTLDLTKRHVKTSVAAWDREDGLELLTQTGDSRVTD